jgi:hypothetical protein
MEEEDEDNDGEVAAVEDVKDEADEPMDEAGPITRVPGRDGVPPLPGRPQATKVNGVVHARQTS